MVPPLDLTVQDVTQVMWETFEAEMSDDSEVHPDNIPCCSSCQSECVGESNCSSNH